MIDTNNKELNLVDNNYIRITERIFGHTILCTDIEYSLYKEHWSPMYLKKCDKYLNYAKEIAPKLNKKYHFTKDRDWYSEEV